ncbi:MAG TPA: GEVED domain-containing protein [Phycisphaerae bacterium]|nr:GEVED domain-containing protein [Phycisphaerae bacterium]
MGGPCDDGFCCKGDVDQSGDLGGPDVQMFANALLAPADCGTAEFCAADADDNGFLEFEDADAFVALILAGNPCPSPPDNYCSAGALDEFEEEFIARVVIESLNNPSGGVSPENYQNFTAVPPPNLAIGAGSTITVSITGYFADDRVKVWVDWNHDSDFFDAGEEFSLIDSGAPGMGTATGAIVPPGGAVLGATRMRVRLFYSFDDELDFGPCGQSEFGEVEDYTVNVAP